jgi:hypothetical protein
MDIFNTGVPLASGKYLDDRQPLGRYLVTAIPQFPDDDFESFSRVCQLESLRPK